MQIDLDRIRQAPKVLLHDHLDGGLRPATILDLAEREGYVVAAGHFHPIDHIGKVVRLEGRRYWQAL